MLTRRAALLASAAVAVRSPGPGAATLDLAHRHDPGRHPGDRRRARPGHRGHPLHGLHDVRPAGGLGPLLGERARQAGARPRHQVVPGPGRSDEMDLRAAPGREVPSRCAVHGRRRDLQPRPHAQRQVAFVRPAGPQRADRRRLAAGRLSQDRRLQGRAADQGRRHDHAVAAQPLSHRQRRQFREGRQGLAGLPQIAVGHRSVEDEGVDAARARRARAQHRSIGTRTASPRPSAWCCCRSPTSSTRTAALLSGRVDWIEAPAPDLLDKLQRGRLQDRNQRHPAHVALHAQHAAGRADRRHPRAQGDEPRDRPRRHGEGAERACGAGGRLRADRPSVVRHAQLQDQVRSGRGQEADGRGGLRAGQAAQDQDRDLDLGLGPDVSADHERGHPAAMGRDRHRRRVPGDGLERAPERDATGREVAGRPTVSARST